GCSPVLSEPDPGHHPGTGTGRSLRLAGTPHRYLAAVHAQHRLSASRARSGTGHAATAGPVALHSRRKGGLLCPARPGPPLAKGGCGDVVGFPAANQYTPTMTDAV